MLMIVSHCIFYLLVFVSRGTTDLICKHPASQANNADMKSCICVVENIRGTPLPTVLNLCQLGRDYCHVIHNTRDAEHDKSIKIIRYYIVNLLQRIQYSEKNSNPICNYKLSSLDTVNCPSKSMSCLASKVTYECSNNDKDSVCTTPLWNADPYGFSDSNWTIRRPSLNDPEQEDLKTATAVIQMQGGPCYFCPPTASDHGPIAKDLGTVIGLFCDERITDEGRLVIQSGPNAGSPNVRFHLHTSSACYEFQPKQRCNFKSDVCKASKPFSCTSADDYTFSFPMWANRSVLKVPPNVEYVFGFCAHDVDCSTHDGHGEVRGGVLICKKLVEGSRVRRATVIAYYKDINEEVILRPNGFVWRISATDNGKLDAVISFQCDMSKPIDSQDFEMDVLHEGKPFLLTLRHRCFCPNPPTQCRERQKPTAKPSRQDQDSDQDILIVLGVLGCGLLILAIFVIIKVNHGPTVGSPHPSNGPPSNDPPSNGTPSNGTPSNGTLSNGPPSNTPPSSSTTSWYTAFSSLLSLASVFNSRSASPISHGSRRKVRSADTTLDDFAKPSETTHLLPRKAKSWT